MEKPQVKEVVKPEEKNLVGHNKGGSTLRMGEGRMAGGAGDG